LNDAAPVVAAFDVDGTLTTRDCVVPFLRRLGTTRLVLGLLRRAPAVAVAGAQRNRDRLKELATAAALTGRPVAEVEPVAEAFAAVIRRWLRDDTHARLRWHRQQGHTVVFGELVGANCRGPEKLRRFDEWLASRGMARGDGLVLWAYGDSAGDRELLAAADHPVWASTPVASVPATG
jgi:phosphatidylglycerophosphatase C